MKNLWVPLSAAALSLALAAGCKKHEGDTSSTRTTSATDEGRTSSTERPTTPPSAALSSEDKEFMTKAAQGGMLEVALGREATGKATSPEIKAFGNRMVTDHSKANDELKQLAAKKGITLPAELDAEHKAKLEKLSKLSGAEFDKAYADDTVEDHEEDVKEFRKASMDVKDPDLRAWAANALPTLEKHLPMAKSLEAKTKKR